MKTELGSAVVSGYINGEGKGVAGVYTTVDDSFLVVRVSVFNELFSLAEARRTSPMEMSFKEAKEKYGDQIIDEFFEANGMLDEYGERCLNPSYTPARRENQKKATIANIKKSEYNKALIIHAVLEGLTKVGIENSLGFSRPTINKAVNALTKQDFERLWGIYKETVFAGIDLDTYRLFLHHNCDYKAWRAYLCAKRDFAFQEKVNKAIAEQIALNKAEKEAAHDEVVTSAASLMEMFDCEEV